MSSYAFLDGQTRIARDEAIERLKQAITNADGVVVDVSFFGLSAIRLTVELEASALASLRQELEASGTDVFVRCAAEIDPAHALSQPLLVMLHVAFVPADADAGVGAAAS